MSSTDNPLILSPIAGKPAPDSLLIDIAGLVTAYYSESPDPAVPQQRVAFGTSGHRGSSFERSFNEAHVLAISQAICQYRREMGIGGPLFMGIDTHALSEPAFSSALEVLAANDVEVMMAPRGEYTATPAISHAILCYNRGRTSDFADGIVITPSHNPPDSGGFKYNPPNGGPADTGITSWIERQANALLENGLQGVKRVSLEKALRASTTHTHDYINTYVNDLANVIDMDAIRDSNIHIGVDPLGGAGVNYWAVIGERYRLNMSVVSTVVDATFRFMTVDWDGKIRMDPSSPYAMQSLIDLKDTYDIAFACDTDHDRHGIVTPSRGLMPPNHYLAVSIWYLFQQQNRPLWNPEAAVGKTLVSSQMIDRVCNKLGRRVFEVPVGFKWFVDGLQDGSLGFVGEESAGATFSRKDGSVWTTDKDGFIPSLLAAELTARTGRDPAQIYRELGEELGDPVYTRVDAAATPEQKKRLGKLSAAEIKSTTLAGDPVTGILSHAPGNGAAIGGLKVMSEHGWFAARPSGTEDIYKIYAESFQGPEHLQRIIDDAQTMVSETLTAT